MSEPTTQAGRELLRVVGHLFSAAGEPTTPLLDAILAIEAEAVGSLTAENAALREALHHIAYLGSSVPLGMDPESFYQLEMNEAIKTAAWALR